MYTPVQNQYHNSEHIVMSFVLVSLQQHIFIKQSMQQPMGTNDVFTATMFPNGDNYLVCLDQWLLSK
jgi:hypothetical protein